MFSSRCLVVVESRGREQRHEHQREHPKRPLLVIDLGRNGV